jgi:hypothetical protein
MFKIINYLTQMSVRQYNKSIASNRREFMKAGDMQGYAQIIQASQPKMQEYMQKVQMHIFDTAGCPPQQFQAT